VAGSGIFGRTDSPSGWAGYFEGNVYVKGDIKTLGSLSRTGGGFQIDHPLDPENQYLNHSFVESPDMKNLYDGMAILDENGTAWVTLPEWFQSLNKDIRYQLTSVGAPGPNLYIAKEISDSRFQIAGGAPGTKVSWQVTGIRHDPWANANRMPTEEDKPADEAGKYLYPEAYNLPESRGINHRTLQETQPDLSSVDVTAP
jgi:hypothetical protein